MFDPDVLTSQSLANPPSVIEISVRPFIVVAAESKRELLRTTDDLD